MHYILLVNGSYYIVNDESIKFNRFWQAFHWCWWCSLPTKLLPSNISEKQQTLKATQIHGLLRWNYRNDKSQTYIFWSCHLWQIRTSVKLDRFCYFIKPDMYYLGLVRIFHKIINRTHYQNVFTQTLSYVFLQPYLSGHILVFQGSIKVSNLVYWQDLVGSLQYYSATNWRANVNTPEQQSADKYKIGDSLNSKSIT